MARVAGEGSAVLGGRLGRVNLLWARGPLTLMSRMSLHSWCCTAGATPVVWSYDQRPDDLPFFAEWRDAREVMPEDELAKYAFRTTGQLALASDLFLMLVNYREGGWVGHLDVTFRRPPKPSASLFRFGRHFRFPLLSMAIWHAPAGRSAIREAAEEAAKNVSPANWRSMMEILAKHVRKRGIFPEHHLVTDDRFHDLWPLFRPGVPLDTVVPPEVDAIHWCASSTPAGMFEDAPHDSFFGQLRNHLLGE